MDGTKGPTNDPQPSQERFLGGDHTVALKEQYNMRNLRNVGSVKVWMKWRNKRTLRNCLGGEHVPNEVGQDAGLAVTEDRCLCGPSLLGPPSLRCQRG